MINYEQNGNVVFTNNQALCEYLEKQTGVKVIAALGPVGLRENGNTYEVHTMEIANYSSNIINDLNTHHNINGRDEIVSASLLGAISALSPQISTLYAREIVVRSETDGTERLILRSAYDHI